MKLRKKLKFEIKTENNDNITSTNTKNNKSISFNNYNITESFDYSAQKKKLRELAKNKTIKCVLK